MKYSEQLNEIAKAMSGLQSEIRDAEKDVQGHGYKYADLYQVLSLIRPLLLKHGLSFTQHIENADDKVLIETMVIHTSGQWFSSVIAMPPTPSQRMSAAQSVGSAITYGRRYALTAIFGITQTAEDTDAAPERYDAVKKKDDVSVSAKEYKKYSPHSGLPPPTIVVVPSVHAKAMSDLFEAKDLLGAAELLDTMSLQEKTDMWPNLIRDEKDWVKNIIRNMPKKPEVLKA